MPKAKCKPQSYEANQTFYHSKEANCWENIANYCTSNHC